MKYPPHPTRHPITTGSCKRVYRARLGRPYRGDSAAIGKRCGVLRKHRAAARSPGGEGPPRRARHQTTRRKPPCSRSRGARDEVGGDVLSHRWTGSTIRATGLNGRVREGNGCFPRAMATNHHSAAATRAAEQETREERRVPDVGGVGRERGAPVSTWGESSHSGD